MKTKFFGILLILCTFLLVGCGKTSKDDVLKDLTKKIEKSKGYYVEGKMTIMNNDDTYEYDVKVGTKEGDFYKVDLTNLTNNHKQVILRNKEGVFVVTPSLNKSFRFQSEWPYNNSQVYLLKSIIEDLKNDDKKEFTVKDDTYIFTSKVNYPNNKKLIKQEVVVNKKLEIKEVRILDGKGNLQIKMEFKKTDLNSSFKDDYFALEQNQVANAETKTATTSKIEDVIYPLYVPMNTHLTSKDILETDAGERLILTFDGDSPFILIEETAKYEEEHVTLPTFGDPEFVLDAIASVGENSITWTSNGVEYYVISNVMEKAELLEVARSISTIPVAK